MLAPGQSAIAQRLEPPLSFEKKDDSVLSQLAISDSPEILCCITLYNESGSALLDSLAGIQRNINYLISIGRIDLANKITLCLIFDGRDCMSKSAIQLLENLNLYPTKPVSPKSHLHIFESQLSPKLLQQEIALQQSEAVAEAVESRSAPAETAASVLPRVLLCIKENNAGKLDSHHLFFAQLSPVLQPNYCVQMDVGSIPEAPSFYRLWQFLESHADAGGAIGSLIVPMPERSWHVVSLWQFGNFWLDALLFRPAESFSGYLSVLSGQLTMIRWRSLVGSETGLPQTQSPLTQYFRGLGPLNAFEANMFLAEDRVLGFGVATGKMPGWRLAYLPSVVTMTDVCVSLAELLRQRRRWINSAFACRLWVFAKMPGCLFDCDVAIAQKLGLLTAAPLYLLKTITEWFYPAISLTICWLIYSLCATRLAAAQLPVWPLQGLFVSSLMLLSVQLLLCLSDRLSERFWLANMAYGAIGLSAVIGILVMTGCYWLLAAIAGTLALIAGLLAVHSPQRIRAAAYIPAYFLIDAAMTLLMRTYAFWRVSDCSWGTKGLNEGTPRRQYQCYFVSLWLISNLLLGVTIFKAHWFSAAVVFAGLDLAFGLLGGTLSALQTLYQRLFRRISYE
ncbi:MAG: hypothetical protein F6J97_17575 [Leptolyngbya sp. SIO4C1]|nr:hypothetical protein [Leptolyngbya sp. SIO4C1]